MFTVKGKLLSNNKVIELIQNNDCNVIYDCSKNENSSEKLLRCYNNDSSLKVDIINKFISFNNNANKEVLLNNEKIISLYISLNNKYSDEEEREYIRKINAMYSKIKPKLLNLIYPKLKL